MNVFLHIINSILLFLVFMMMTGLLWRSAFVAFLFALHPINVDSVAGLPKKESMHIILHVNHNGIYLLLTKAFFV